MSSEPGRLSPYKEIGLSGWSSHRPPVRLKQKRTPEEKGIVFGHVWEPNWRQLSGKARCIHCGGKRFTIESQKCGALTKRIR